MIVAGRVTEDGAVLCQIYDQMAEPKWVLAMGVRLVRWDVHHAIVQGVDHAVPVDIYLPGCPPRLDVAVRNRTARKIQQMPLGINQRAYRGRRGGVVGPAHHRDA